ncbi:MAG TPA: SRPBCC family protein [Acidimicrobiales bacterium]|nr:SRPBCC family protein [Acidimicrobiales bacterium]
MSTAYHFFTEWRVTATVDEVKAVLNDGTSLRRWWPSVYLSVEEVDPGGPDGVGRTLDLHTKGWLPYLLRWTLYVTEPVTDEGFALSATGDLEGTGRWTFEPQGPEVRITYDWQVMASKPLLRRLSRVLRPAFSANHHWAMKRGEESLQLELRRRRNEANVPPAPPPTFRWMLRMRGMK